MSFKKPHIFIFLVGLTGVIHGLNGKIDAALCCMVILILIAIIDKNERIIESQKKENKDRFTDWL